MTKGEYVTHDKILYFKKIKSKKIATDNVDAQGSKLFLENSITLKQADIIYYFLWLKIGESPFPFCNDMLFYYHELCYYGDQIVILQAESFLQLLATQYNVIKLYSVFSIYFP